MNVEYGFAMEASDILGIQKQEYQMDFVQVRYECEVIETGGE